MALFNVIEEAPGGSQTAVRATVEAESAVKAIRKYEDELLETCRHTIRSLMAKRYHAKPVVHAAKS